MDKAFASLTSGLLARKGAARPAMRPQRHAGDAAAGAIEDLGWNDMGEAAEASRDHLIAVRLPASLSGPAAAAVPAVRLQQEEIAREFAAPAPAATDTPARVRAAALVRSVAQGRKAAFTLRLDADRHLRLRLACAVEHRSAQQLVIAALDRMLAELPEVERLAASLPPAGEA